MTTIRIEGIDELIKRIDNLSKLTKTKKAIEIAAKDLNDRMKERPPQPNRPNPMIRLNPKVRRGFFYHLNKGDIEVPYRRGKSPGSEKSQNRWTVRMENYGFRAIIGNDASYIRLVQDSAKQTSYHRQTGWLTTNQAAKLYGGNAIKTIEQAFRSEVENG